MTTEESVCDGVGLPGAIAKPRTGSGYIGRLYRHAATLQLPGPMSVFRPRLPFDPFANLDNPWRVLPVLPGVAPAVVLLIGGPLSLSLPLSPRLTLYSSVPG